MKFSVKILPILLLIAQANAEEICSIRATGETEEEAQQKATNSLAMKIKSKVVISSKSEETIDGRKSSQKDISTQEVYSELRNQHAVKYKDEFFSTACISSEDAAQPYIADSRMWTSNLEKVLNDLKDIREKSGKIEAWEKVKAIYEELKNLEAILISLKQMDMNLQREYNVYYSKAKNEYESFLSRLDKGIYVESSDPYLKSRISRSLTNYGCILAEKEMAALYLELYVEEDQKQADFYYCTAHVRIELKGNKINPYKDIIPGTKEGWTDMETACKKSTEKSVDKILNNKLKEKIINGGCK
ncbi:MAG: hypothetical protein LBC87_05310 [Fibromonadaceae bacterium]|jgi:hypothetical protein|nr:hypothetical protein [Fibromonadaceae bacterium]